MARSPLQINLLPPPAALPNSSIFRGGSAARSVFAKHSQALRAWAEAAGRVPRPARGRCGFLSRSTNPARRRRNRNAHRVPHSRPQFFALARCGVPRLRALPDACVAPAAQRRLLHPATCASGPPSPSGLQFPSAKAAPAPPLPFRCDFRRRPVPSAGLAPHRLAAARAHGAGQFAAAAWRGKLHRAALHNKCVPIGRAPKVSEAARESHPAIRQFLLCVSPARDRVCVWKCR